MGVTTQDVQMLRYAMIYGGIIGLAMIGMAIIAPMASALMQFGSNDVG